MKQTFWLLISLISLNFSMAMAEEVQTPISPVPSTSSANEEDVVIVKESSSVVVEHSSEHNRMNKKWEASYMPIGFGPVPGVSMGLNVAYFLTRKSEIVLSLSKLTKGNTCSGALSCDQSGNVAGVYYKRFFGNSFYGMAGVEKRKVSYDEKMSGYSSYHYSFDGDSTSFSMVIGNQWHWSNFTIGCDWLGYSAPIISSISNEKSIGSPPYDQGMYDKERYLVTTGSFQGLKLYVGASF